MGYWLNVICEDVMLKLTKGRGAEVQGSRGVIPDHEKGYVV